MKTVVVLQSNYLPWKGYFDLIHDADEFVFYDEVQYTKNDWRNRNQVYTKNGIQWLTIPIAKEAVKQKISEVEITDQRWQDIHYKTLVSAYGRAPFYCQLKPLIESVYLHHTWRRLVDVNRFWTQQISTRLGINTRFLDAQNYPLSGDRVSRLVHLLCQVGATRYLSGPSARDYLTAKEHVFAEHGIELAYKNYEGYRPYRQNREPFVHGVSILDLIAHLDYKDIPGHIWLKDKDHNSENQLSP